MDFDFSNLGNEPIPVKVGDASYFLCEATAGAAKAYINARSSTLVLSTDGAVHGVRSIGDLEPLIVSLCLFHDDNGQVGKAVSLKDIEQLPYRIIHALAEKAREISGFEEHESLSSVLLQIFSRDDSPVELSVLKEWIKGLTGPKIKPAHKMLRAWEKDPKE